MNLRAQNIFKYYGSRPVVNDVSIDLNQGEIVGLLGPNGAGKTTTFYMMVGLVNPFKGKVFLDKTDITKLPMYKRAQMGVGYLPQEASVFRTMSVEDNILSVLEMTNLSKSEQKYKCESLIDEFGLSKVRKINGRVLSGGERRRTEIARALATNPKFILLDEPFAGVDPIAVEDIQKIVSKLKEKNIGILISKGDFITFHDSDDYSVTHRIRTQTRFLNNNLKYDACIASFISRIKKTLIPAEITLFFRRSVLTKNGFFDSVRVGADTEFRKRLIKNKTKSI